MINKLKTVTSSHSEDEKSLLALNITMAFWPIIVVKIFLQ
jgi:hypothetical protein